MIKHEFKDIQPQLNKAGELTSIAFTLVSTDGDVQAFLKWHTPAQLAGIINPVQADYLAKCEEIAQNLGMYADQEKKIQSEKVKNTPTLPPKPMTDPVEQRKAWVVSVDDTIAAIITKQTRFQMGYVEREAAALAYKERGFTGDPTVWVTRFADNTGMPYKDAALLILSQANQLRNALKELEALRMDKYLILAAKTQELAEAQFNRIIRDVKAIAGKL